MTATIYLHPCLRQGEAYRIMVRHKLRSTLLKSGRVVLAQKECGQNSREYTIVIPGLELNEIFPAGFNFLL